jgi:hypothetical protein
VESWIAAITIAIMTTMDGMLIVLAVDVDTASYVGTSVLQVES